jgi:hypothetical protein
MLEQYVTILNQARVEKEKSGGSGGDTGTATENRNGGKGECTREDEEAPSPNTFTCSLLESALKGPVEGMG